MATVNRSIVISFLLLIASQFSFGQNGSDLSRINQAAKNPFLPVEQVDQLAMQLRQISPENDPEQLRLLYETHQLISNLYVSNNHFKQACQVYERYLRIKETKLAESKVNALNAAVASVNDRASKLDQEVLSTRSEAETLKNETNRFEILYATWKQVSSFVIIGLTVLFAFMLVRSGLRMNTIKKETTEIRETIRQRHRMSVVGVLSEGFTNGLSSQLEYIRNAAKDASKKLSDVKFSPQEPAGLSAQDAIKKFNDAAAKSAT